MPDPGVAAARRNLNRCPSLGGNHEDLTHPVAKAVKDHLATIDTTTGLATVIGPYGMCMGVTLPSQGNGSCTIEGMEAIAFAPTVPPALRGPADVASFAPSGLPQPTDDLLARVGRMYQSDPQLHAMWGEALSARGMAAGQAPGQKPEDLGRLAASFLSKPDGPRIAMLETGGWDTHTGEQFRLTAQLKALDTMLAALRDNLGPAWDQTVVLVATEFGRTAAVNGTGGTDHGTASAAMLFGGAVKGGRVLADWPGLAPTNLYEQRDLKPTIGLDALIAGVAAESFGIDPERTGKALFPTANFGRPLQGLIRT